MPMRLLSKSDIVKAKSVARKLDIDEGAKLARRIDNLREVAAQEEASLTKFRSETIANIHADITQATQKRDTLKAEVATLEDRRKELLKPLTREWNELKKERKAVAKEADIARTRLADAQEAESRVKKAIKDTSNALARASTVEQRAIDKLKNADEVSKNAQLALDVARQTEAKAKELARNMTKELARRDMDMAARERDLGYKEDDLNKQDAMLQAEWKLLADRKATLERQLKRLKK